MITEDQISAGQTALQELQKKVTATIEFYNSLQTLSIPEAIIEVGDGVDQVTEFLVPKLDQKELEYWRTRAISVEAVNAALADLEFGTVQELTQSPVSNFASAIWGIVEKFEWIIGHIGQLSLLLAELLGTALYYYGDEIKSGFYNSLVGLFTFDFKKLWKSYLGLWKTQFEVTKYIASGAIFGLLAAILVPTIEALSAAKYAATLAPVLALKKATEEAIKKAAFPQGKGRVRRTKPHRVRG